jgi:hypothetical protein
MSDVPDFILIIYLANVKTSEYFTFVKEITSVISGIRLHQNHAWSKTFPGRI